MTARLLHPLFPKLRRTLPILDLGTFPTPIEPFPLDDSRSKQLWIKREDQSSSLYGGNKVRKLEVLLGSVNRSGKGGVYCIGVTCSNWVAAASLHARAKNMDVHLVMTPIKGDAHNASENEQTSLNHASSTIFSPHLTTLLPVALARWIRLLPSRPLCLPWGGTSTASSLGYVGAAFELQQQIESKKCPLPSWIVLPLGTGGTAAGLLAGLELTRLPIRILGISIVQSPSACAASIRFQARCILRRLGRSPHLTKNRLVVDPHQIGRGYGWSTPQAKTAVIRAREERNIQLETTYSGKALAGLLARQEAGTLGNDPILFWNTFAGPHSSTPSTPTP